MRGTHRRPVHTLLDENLAVSLRIFAHVRTRVRITAQPMNLARRNGRICWFIKGASAGAANDGAKALLLEPGSIKAMYRRGLALTNMLEFAEAKKILLQAAKLSPKDKNIRAVRSSARFAPVISCTRVCRSVFLHYGRNAARRGVSAYQKP